MRLEDILTVAELEEYEMWRDETTTLTDFDEKYDTECDFLGLGGSDRDRDLYPLTREEI